MKRGMRNFLSCENYLKKVVLYQTLEVVTVDQVNKFITTKLSKIFVISSSNNNININNYINIINIIIINVSSNNNINRQGKLIIILILLILLLLMSF